LICTANDHGSERKVVGTRFDVHGHAAAPSNLYIHSAADFCAVTAREEFARKARFAPDVALSLEGRERSFLVDDEAEARVVLTQAPDPNTERT
jgi:hypothetical protein